MELSRFQMPRRQILSRWGKVSFEDADADLRLSERNKAGLERARAQGNIGGRPKAEDAEPKLVAKVGRLRAQGQSIRVIAEAVGKSPNTVQRLMKAAGN